jgi:putative transposase
MKASQLNEEQIITILREQEAGAKMADVYRKHEISGATFYKWKSRFGGLDVSDVRRLNILEAENAKLMRILAEAMQTIRCRFKKNGPPVTKREAVAHRSRV